MDPITDAREISKIAYGFMGTQALVAALDVNVFGQLSSGALTSAELAEKTGVRADRLAMLLAPLVALGLLVKETESYANAPAAAKYLDPEAPEYFGEYIRLQVGKQIYPHALNIGQTLAGAPVNLYTEVAADAEEAAAFSHSQHVGSLGPAHLVSRKVKLDAPQQLLDVAGGSGAFTISLCRKYPKLRATILDFPAVTEVARRYVGDAGLGERVSYLEDSALEADWPGDQDIVLMSYLLSAVGREEVGMLMCKALAALRPGGQLVLHDFMLDADHTGPLSAALWMLVLVTSSEPVCLTAEYLTEEVSAAGFSSVWSDDLVPTITKVVVGVKKE